MTTQPDDCALLLKALAFAAHKHRHQRRKGVDQDPYVNHPIEVANVLANEGGIADTVVLCAAALHDTVEDTDTSFAELERHFGKDIASVVAEITDDKSLPKAERKRLQVERAAHISTRARLVKLADKICNVRDMARDPPADWSPERRAEYFAWAKRVVDALRGVHAELEAVFDASHAARPRRI